LRKERLRAMQIMLHYQAIFGNELNGY